MKSSKVITLVLLVSAGGLVGVGAQSARFYYNTNATDYPLQLGLTNAQRFAYTAGLPAMTTVTLESLSGGVLTDGGGHIAGSVYARIYFGGPNGPVTNYGAYNMTITGTTGNQGTNPLVKLTLTGNGYDADSASNYPNASLSLKFTSTNRYTLVDVPSSQVTVTSSTYTVTFVDGSTQVLTDGPVTVTNPAYTALLGTMSGSIHPGQHSSLNNGHTLSIKELAALTTASRSWTVVDGTNLVEQVLGSGLILDILTNINAQVIQPLPGSKLYLNASVGTRDDLFLASGTANTNNNSLKWSAAFSGVAFANGSSLNANGYLGPLVVAYQPTSDTNNYPLGYIPQVVQKAITNITVTSGRLLGQKVFPVGGFSVPASLPLP